MSNPLYNPYASGSQAGTDPRGVPSRLGPGANLATGDSSGLATNPGQMISQLPRSMSYMPRSTLPSDMEHDLDAQISRAREEVRLLSMQQAKDQNTYLRNTSSDEVPSWQLGTAGYSLSSSSTTHGHFSGHSNLMQSSGSSSPDWLSSYQRETAVSSHFYSASSSSSSSVPNVPLSHSSQSLQRYPASRYADDGRGEPSSAAGPYEPFGQPSSSSSFSTAAEPSQPKYTSESAIDILKRFDLKEEDLENLCAYSEDVISPANLPFLLREIRTRKAKMAVAQPGVAPQPHTEGCKSGAEYPGSSGVEVRRKEEVPPPIRQQSQVIDYGHASKYTGGIGEEFGRGSSSSAGGGWSGIVLEDNFSTSAGRSRKVQPTDAKFGKYEAEVKSHVQTSSTIAPSASYSLMKNAPPTQGQELTKQSQRPDQTAKMIQSIIRTPKRELKTAQSSTASVQANAPKPILKAKTHRPICIQLPGVNPPGPNPDVGATNQEKALAHGLVKHQPQLQQQQGPPQTFLPPTFWTGPPSFGPRNPVVPLLPNLMSIRPKHSVGDGDAVRQVHGGPVPPKQPDPPPVTLPKASPVTVSKKSLLTMISGYAATMPKAFPHTCCLCVKECANKKHWLVHQNTSEHLANCKLLQEHPSGRDVQPSPSSSSQSTKHRAISRSRSPTRRFHSKGSLPSRRRSPSPRRTRSRSPRRARSPQRSRSRSSRRSRSRSQSQGRACPRQRSRSTRRSRSPHGTRHNSRRTRSGSRERWWTQDKSVAMMARKLIERSGVQCISESTSLEDVVQSLAPALLAELTKLKSSSASTSSSSSVKGVKRTVKVTEKEASSSSSSSSAQAAKKEPPSSTSSFPQAIKKEPPSSSTSSFPQAIKKEPPSSSTSLCPQAIKKEPPSSSTSLCPQAIKKEPPSSSTSSFPQATKKELPSSSFKNTVPAKPAAQQQTETKPTIFSAYDPVFLDGIPETATYADVLFAVAKFGKPKELKLDKSQNQACVYFFRSEAAQALVGFTGFKIQGTTITVTQRTVAFAEKQENPLVTRSSPPQGSVAAEGGAKPCFPLVPAKNLVKPLQLVLKGIQCENVLNLNAKFHKATRTNVMVTELPISGFTVFELGSKLSDMGFQQQLDHLYVLPEHRMAFFGLISRNNVKKMLAAFKGQVTEFKGAMLRFHVPKADMHTPVKFFETLLNWGDITYDKAMLEDRLVFVRNIPLGFEKEVHNAVMLAGPVSLYLPLKNAIFVLYSTVEAADHFGLWVSKLKFSDKMAIVRSLLPPGKLELAVPPTGNQSVPLVLPGLKPPFWIPMKNVPFSFPTSTPMFKIPDVQTVTGMEDVERVQQWLYRPTVVMATGLPPGDYGQEDLVRLAWPFWSDRKPASVFYNVLGLPLERRAFFSFSDWESCRGFVSSHLRKPFFVGGRKLTLHFLLQPLNYTNKEISVYKALLPLTAADSEPTQASELLIVEMRTVSFDIIQTIIAMATAVGTVVGCLPLANRVILQMWAPGEVFSAMQAYNTVLKFTKKMQRKFKMSDQFIQAVGIQNPFKNSNSFRIHVSGYEINSLEFNRKLSKTGTTLVSQRPAAVSGQTESKPAAVPSQAGSQATTAPSQAGSKSAAASGQAGSKHAAVPSQAAAVSRQAGSKSAAASSQAVSKPTAVPSQAAAASGQAGSESAAASSQAGSKSAAVSGQAGSQAATAPSQAGSKSAAASGQAGSKSTPVPSQAAAVSGQAVSQPAAASSQAGSNSATVPSQAGSKSAAASGQAVSKSTAVPSQAGSKSAAVSGQAGSQAATVPSQAGSKSAAASGQAGSQAATVPSQAGSKSTPVPSQAAAVSGQAVSQPAAASSQAGSNSATVPSQAGSKSAAASGQAGSKSTPVPSQAAAVSGQAVSQPAAASGQAVSKSTAVPSQAGSKSAAVSGQAGSQAATVPSQAGGKSAAASGQAVSKSTAVPSQAGSKSAAASSQAVSKPTAVPSQAAAASGQAGSESAAASSQAGSKAAAAPSQAGSKSAAVSGQAGSQAATVPSQAGSKSAAVPSQAGSKSAAVPSQAGSKSAAVSGQAGSKSAEAPGQAGSKTATVSGQAGSQAATVPSQAGSKSAAASGQAGSKSTAVPSQAGSKSAAASGQAGSKSAEAPGQAGSKTATVSGQAGSQAATVPSQAGSKSAAASGQAVSKSTAVPSQAGSKSAAVSGQAGSQAATVPSQAGSKSAAASGQAGSQAATVPSQAGSKSTPVPSQAAAVSGQAVSQPAAASSQAGSNSATVPSQAGSKSAAASGQAGSKSTPVPSQAAAVSGQAVSQPAAASGQAVSKSTAVPSQAGSKSAAVSGQAGSQAATVPSQAGGKSAAASGQAVSKSTAVPSQAGSKSAAASSQAVSKPTAVPSQAAAASGQAGSESAAASSQAGSKAAAAPSQAGSKSAAVSGQAGSQAATVPSQAGSKSAAVPSQAGSKSAAVPSQAGSKSAAVSGQAGSKSAEAPGQAGSKTATVSGQAGSQAATVPSQAGSKSAAASGQAGSKSTAVPSQAGSKSAAASGQAGSKSAEAPGQAGSKTATVSGQAGSQAATVPSQAGSKSAAASGQAGSKSTAVPSQAGSKSAAASGQAGSKSTAVPSQAGSKSAAASGQAGSKSTAVPSQAGSRSAAASGQAGSKSAEAPGQAGSKTATVSGQAGSQAATVPSQAGSKSAAASGQAGSKSTAASGQAGSKSTAVPSQAGSKSAAASGQAGSKTATVSDQAGSQAATAPSQAGSKSAAAPNQACSSRGVQQEASRANRNSGSLRPSPLSSASSTGSSPSRGKARSPTRKRGRSQQGDRKGHSSTRVTRSRRKRKSPPRESSRRPRETSPAERSHSSPGSRTRRGRSPAAKASKTEERIKSSTQDYVDFDLSEFVTVDEIGDVTDSAPLPKSSTPPSESGSSSSKPSDKRRGAAAKTRSAKNASSSSTSVAPRSSNSSSAKATADSSTPPNSSASSLLPSSSNKEDGNIKTTALNPKEETHKVSPSAGQRVKTQEVSKTMTEGVRAMSDHKVSPEAGKTESQTKIDETAHTTDLQRSKGGAEGSTPPEKDGDVENQNGGKEVPREVDQIMNIKEEGDGMKIQEQDEQMSSLSPIHPEVLPSHGGSGGLQITLETGQLSMSDKAKSEIKTEAKAVLEDQPTVLDQDRICINDKATIEQQPDEEMLLLEDTTATDEKMPEEGSLEVLDSVGEQASGSRKESPLDLPEEQGNGRRDTAVNKDGISEKEASQTSDSADERKPTETSIDQRDEEENVEDVYQVIDCVEDLPSANLSDGDEKKKQTGPAPKGRKPAKEGHQSPRRYTKATRKSKTSKGAVVEPEEAIEEEDFQILDSVECEPTEDPSTAPEGGLGKPEGKGTLAEVEAQPEEEEEAAFQVVDSVEDEPADHPATRRSTRGKRGRRAKRATQKDETEKTETPPLKKMLITTESPGPRRSGRRKADVVSKPSEEPPAQTHPMDDDLTSTGSSAAAPSQRRSSRRKTGAASLALLSESESPLECEEPLYQVVDSVEDEGSITATPGESEQEPTRGEAKEEEPTKEENQMEDAEEKEAVPGVLGSNEENALVNLEEVSDKEEGFPDDAAEEEELHRKQNVAKERRMGEERRSRGDGEKERREVEEGLVTLDEVGEEETGEGDDQGGENSPGRRGGEGGMVDGEIQTLVTLDEIVGEEPSPTESRPPSQANQSGKTSSPYYYDYYQNQFIAPVQEYRPPLVDAVKQLLGMAPGERVPRPVWKAALVKEKERRKMLRSAPTRSQDPQPPANSPPVAGVETSSGPTPEKERAVLQDGALKSREEDKAPPTPPCAAPSWVVRLEAEPKPSATQDKPGGSGRASLKDVFKQRRDVVESQCKKARSLSPSVPADFKLPPFIPHNPLGMDYVVPKSGFFCSLCSSFYEDEETAKSLHCSSLVHYENMRKHYQKLQAEQTKTYQKKTSA